jgi:hypothetical protein
LTFVYRAGAFFKLPHIFIFNFDASKSVNDRNVI